MYELYYKICFKNSERILETFFHILFLETCKSFELLLNGLSTNKRWYFGKPSEELEKEWKNGIGELKGRCLDLLLQEHCKKLFNLTDIFWCDIKYIDLDVNQLLKVKTHLDKLEKIQSKTKLKKLRNISTNSLLKKMVLERFGKHLPFFNLKYDFNAFCYSKFPDFENLYTLLTIKKGSSIFRTSSFSQGSQDESVVFDFVKSEGGENEIITSAGNTPDIEEKHDNGNINNIATYKGESLEGKFVTSNVINLSRRNLCEAEISLLSKGLKFVLTANKIDRAKLKTELEEYGRKLWLMWHFRNDEKPFPFEKFRPKSTFKPRNKDTVIQTYLSSLEERLVDLDISSKRFNNLAK